MSHLFVQGSFLPDGFGPGYEVSPRATRSLGFKLQNSSRPFRKSGTLLPKWLNFKISEGGRARNQVSRATQSSINCAAHSSVNSAPHTSVNSAAHTCVKSLAHTSVTSASHTSITYDKVKEKTSRHDGSRPNRVNKEKNRLQKQIQEHEMKTKTFEWKKNQNYSKVRERRNLLRKQKNRMLRMIRRLYLPSILIIAVGTVFILSSSVHSIGGSTVFWDHKDQFRIIGPSVTVFGAIMLLLTVGLESHSTAKLKKKGILIIDKSLFIHPDFLQERYLNKQMTMTSSTNSYDSEISKLREQSSNWSGTYQDDGFRSFSPSLRSTSIEASEISRCVSEISGLHNLSQRMKRASYVFEDVRKHIQCNRLTSQHIPALEVTSSDKHTANTKTGMLEEANGRNMFLCSSMNSLPSEIHLNTQEKSVSEFSVHSPYMDIQAARFRNGYSEDVSSPAGEIIANDCKVEKQCRFTGDRAAQVQVPRIEITDFVDSSSSTAIAPCNDVSGTMCILSPFSGHKHLLTTDPKLSEEDTPLLESGNIHVKSGRNNLRISEVKFLQVQR